MRIVLCSILCCTALAVTSTLTAQPPGQSRRTTAVTDDLVDRMMAFDANQDGKLTRSEVTDERLLRLFERADLNKDKIVTRSELNVLLVRERAAARGKSSGTGGRGFGGPGGGGGPGFGGPGGGGPGFGGPGDPGGGPGFGGPPQPGQILPPMLRQRLSLAAEQERQADALQEEVNAKLAKILTVEQRQQLQRMRQRGPGGFGPPPGGGRPGGEEPPPPPDRSL
jgi:hypothetical protein